MTSRIRSLPLGLNRHLLSGSAAVATIGVFVGLLALVLWSWSDGAVPAHGLDHIDDDPDKMRSQELDRPLGLTPAAVPPVAENQGFAVPVDTPVDGGQPAVGMQAPPPHPFDTITSSSTTASAVAELNLTIKSMPVDAISGSSVELYLEDDFRVPDSIDRNAVYFTATNPFTADTNNGGPVHAAGSIQVNEGDHYGGARYGNGDWAIRVFIPDMSDAVDGYDGPLMGQTVNLVFTEAAGIRNPSEEGTHSIGYSVIGPTDQPNRGPQVDLGTLHTHAKIVLSDADNTSGYELTVTGYGFNNGTVAGVYVLDREPAEGEECEDIIRNGVELGAAIVGSDDIVAITFEVTVPPFRPGNQNYICMIDGEGRVSRNVAQFHLQSYIRVEPATVNVGDTVRVFAHDYPNTGAAFNELRIAGLVLWPHNSLGGNPINVSHTSIAADGTATLSFEVPSGILGRLRIDAKWGDIRSSAIIVVTDKVTPVTNIRACSGPDAGEVMISWDAVAAATHYRIGYVNMVQDYPRAKASATGEWIEAFIYVDVNAQNLLMSDDGRAQYVLRRLVNGERHAFTVLTSKDVVNTVETISSEYHWPQNPRWQFLTVADPEPECR